MRPPGERAVLLAIALCGILPPLNTTMIAVALPDLLHQLGAGVSGGGWLIASYLIAIAPVQPITGKLGDRHGRRRLMLLGLALFALFSVGAGLSPDLPVLIVMRVLQGLAGALVFPNASGLIRELIPAERRAKAYGLFAGVIFVSAAVGPPIGGGLTAALGWRWIFFVNVPVTVVAAVVLLRNVADGPVPAARPARKLPPFDVGGAVALSLLFGAAAALALEGGRIGGAAVVAPAGVAVATLLAVTLRHEARHPDPVLDPRLFRSRAFSAAAAGVSLGNMSFYTTLLAAPLLFERTTQWSAGHIGIALAALSAPTALLAPLGGALADRSGRRLPALLGQAVVAAALVPLAAWPAAAPPVVIACLAGCGVGGGLAGAAQQAAVVEAVAPDQAGVASGIFSTARYVGGIAGAVVLALLLEGRTGVDGFGALFAVTAAAGLLAAVAGSLLPGRARP